MLYTTFKTNQRGGQTVEQTAYLSCLLDFYGPLLTERQRQLMQLRLDEDFSLAEIAEECSISRQAVSDGIKSAQERLLKLEGSLGLYQRHKAQLGQIERAIALLDANDIPAARQRLDELTKEETDGL